MALALNLPKPVVAAVRQHATGVSFLPGLRIAFGKFGHVGCWSHAISRGIRLASRSLMRGKTSQRPVYVVYPAALFDGWEVVREHDDAPVWFESREAATTYANAQVAMAGGGIVKVENWFGDTENSWQVQLDGANQSTVRVS